MDSVAIPAARHPAYTAEGTYRREAVRTPARFRDRVIAQFRSPQNLDYLRGVFAARVPAGPQRAFTLATFYDAALEYSSGEGRALELLASDSRAQRGEQRRAVDLWGEVRRLNRAFYEDRLALVREHAHTIERRAPRDGLDEDDEPYEMRMFIADSLRPPGLEHLNSQGPLYALREDQSVWAPQRREKFATGGRGASGDEARDVVGCAGEAEADDDVFVHGADDAPWSRGSANRTPEQALAEYWGDGSVATDTRLGALEIAGQAYGDSYAWGNSWRENGGTRFMRYESIPFWQRGGRDGYDTDIEESLGTASRELDGHVRRWDMDRVRDPRGQEYRRYGPRSGHVV